MERKASCVIAVPGLKLKSQLRVGPCPSHQSLMFWNNLALLPLHLKTSKTGDLGSSCLVGKALTLVVAKLLLLLLAGILPIQIF